VSRCGSENRDDRGTRVQRGGDPGDLIEREEPDIESTPCPEFRMRGGRWPTEFVIESLETLGPKRDFEGWRFHVERYR